MSVLALLCFSALGGALVLDLDVVSLRSMLLRLLDLGFFLLGELFVYIWPLLWLSSSLGRLG